MLLGNVTANTLHNMKELQQTTVNTVNTVVKPVSQVTSNAMHKIGDLQVSLLRISNFRINSKAVIIKQFFFTSYPIFMRKERCDQK